MNKRHPLAELIEHVQQLNDWSDRYLGERARALGVDLSSSNISRLKNREIVSIKGSVIRGLAQVLKINEKQVARAALASMGVILEAGQSDLEEAVHTTTEYSERDRRIILSVMSAMRENGEQTDDSSTIGNKNRERESADDGPVISSGEKTGGVGLDQMDFDLAAHPDMELERDRFDAEHGDAGEENQDRD